MSVAVFRPSASALILAIAAALVLDACSGSPAAPSAPTITISAITPASGSTTGGTMVTVTGSNFGEDAILTVGGVTATDLTRQGTTSLSATIGVHPGAGAGDVVVSSGGHMATLPRGFTFYAPSGANQAPIVTGVRTSGLRPNQPETFANIDDAVTLTPAIVNGEISSLLRYAWTGPGAFSPAAGDGTTTWKLPGSLSPSPQPQTATLAVSETFVEGGITHVQMAAPFDFVLQVHDSQKEVMDMGEDFLTRFTQQLSPDEVLHNFSPTCDRGRGRSDEANDVRKNNNDVIEDVNAFRISRRQGFSINFKGACSTQGKPAQLNVDACSSFAVHWEGRDRATNARFALSGIDFVSAVLEDNQWRLCHSTFILTDAYPSIAAVKRFAPN